MLDDGIESGKRGKACRFVDAKQVSDGVRSFRLARPAPGKVNRSIRPVRLEETGTSTSEEE